MGNIIHWAHHVTSRDGVPGPTFSHDPHFMANGVAQFITSPFKTVYHNLSFHAKISRILWEKKKKKTKTDLLTAKALSQSWREAKPHPDSKGHSLLKLPPPHFAWLPVILPFESITLPLYLTAFYLPTLPMLLFPQSPLFLSSLTLHSENSVLSRLLTPSGLKTVCTHLCPLSKYTSPEVKRTCYHQSLSFSLSMLSLRPHCLICYHLPR